MRRQLFQPDLIIVMEPPLVVVNENRRRDVHGVDQAQAFAHAALADQLLNLRRDVDEPAPAGHFEPEMLSERFHWTEIRGQRSAVSTSAIFSMVVQLRVVIGTPICFSSLPR